MTKDIKLLSFFYKKDEKQGSDSQRGLTPRQKESEEYENEKRNV